MHVGSIITRSARIPRSIDMEFGFCFTSLTLNMNLQARLHRDPANEGPPLVKAFGNCQGGKLRYFPGDDGRTPLHQLTDDVC